MIYLVDEEMVLPAGYVQIPHEGKIIITDIGTYEVAIELENESKEIDTTNAGRAVVLLNKVLPARLKRITSFIALADKFNYSTEAEDELDIEEVLATLSYITNMSLLVKNVFSLSAEARGKLQITRVDVNNYKLEKKLFLDRHLTLSQLNLYLQNKHTQPINISVETEIKKEDTVKKVDDSKMTSEEIADLKDRIRSAGGDPEDKEILNIGQQLFKEQYAVLHDRELALSVIMVKIIPMAKTKNAGKSATDKLEEVMSPTAAAAVKAVKEKTSRVNLQAFTGGGGM